MIEETIKLPLPHEVDSDRDLYLIVAVCFAFMALVELFMAIFR